MWCHPSPKHNAMSVLGDFTWKTPSFSLCIGRQRWKKRRILTIIRPKITQGLLEPHKCHNLLNGWPDMCDAGSMVFFSNFLIEPDWRASVGRFRQISPGESHYFKELFATAASALFDWLLVASTRTINIFGWIIAVPLLWT
jgi:hypothetical protein